MYNQILSHLSLVLICRQCTCVVAASVAWATSWTNENMHRQQLKPSQSFTTGIPAKFNSSQLRRHAGSKDWEEKYYWPLLFSYQNSIPGSTSGHVAGASVAYENQALVKLDLSINLFTMKLRQVSKFLIEFPEFREEKAHSSLGAFTLLAWARSELFLTHNSFLQISQMSKDMYKHFKIF